MTGLQSFPPEICSLICQHPILERLDLNAICFISHAFRNEAQRELSYRFPILRGASRVKAWCLSLKCRPHLAKDIKGLVLLLPQPSALYTDDILHLTRALCICVNLKELVVLFQGCRRRDSKLEESDFWMSTRNLLSLIFLFKFKLTKFVNGYFSQDSSTFSRFLMFQPDLESLELHSGNLTTSLKKTFLRHLKTLSCPPQFLDTSYSITRLRLDFEDSTYECEIDALGLVLCRNFSGNMKSLVISLNQSQSHFPEIIRVIAFSNIYIQHLEIHQFLPTQVRP